MGSGGWTFATITSVLGLAAIGIGFWGSPQVFVRYISMKNTGQILPGTATALIWTLLADSGAVLVGIFGRVIYTPAMLDGNADETVAYAAADVVRVSENILPEMSLDLLPAFFAGGFIAMVLSAIMSTIDSLLVVASSAGVRDYWQKTRNPDMSDERLMTLSRRVTIALSLVSFAVGIGIMLYDKDNGVFWAIMFGWSGIAATFCPTMILSLYWSGLTARGAKFAMAAGFLAVPLFKFAAPSLLVSADLADWAERLKDLDVLLPSFIVGFVVAIVVSVLDKKGRARMAGVSDELDEARS